MKRHLVVVGCCLRGNGYPNAEGTIAILTDSKQWEVEDHALWLPEGMRLWQIARGPWTKTIAGLAKLIFGSAWSLATALRRHGRGVLFYAPYPSVFVLLWLRLIPHRFRPRIVADAYISIWDSMFVDRKTPSTGVLSRAAKKLESLAFRCAYRVVVDTEKNRTWMIENFSLHPGSVYAVPLAVETEAYLAIPNKPRHKGELNVLFIGTLIPLHGISVVANAIRSLGSNSGIKFTFIGDGQDAEILEALQKDTDRSPMSWRRSWATTADLVDAISGTDICLGVFGGPQKAARVLPFKLYIAMASGRPIVTQREFSLPDDTMAPPWILTEPTPKDLAAALIQLRDFPDRLVTLGRDARRYYARHLGHEAILRRWNSLTNDPHLRHHLRRQN